MSASTGSLNPQAVRKTEGEGSDRTLEALLERVKGATEADRELDADLAEALGHKITWLPPGDIRNANGGPVIHWQAPHPYAGMREPCPRWSGSLDAVVALCERVLPASTTWKPESPPSSGWRIGVYRGLTPASFKYGHWEAAVFLHAQEPKWHSAKTPALALLAALLEALVKSRSPSLVGG